MFPDTPGVMMLEVGGRARGLCVMDSECLIKGSTRRCVLYSLSRDFHTFDAALHLFSPFYKGEVAAVSQPGRRSKNDHKLAFKITLVRLLQVK